VRLKSYFIIMSSAPSDTVLSIYEWFRKVMASNGRFIRRPKCNDITKTYQYRSVSQFADKVLKMSLTKNEIESLVTEIIRYAKDKKLLGRGTAILNMSNIFVICYNRIEASSVSSDRLIESIKLASSFINGDLAIPESIGGYPKLIRLVNSGLVPIELVAVSKKCTLALQQTSSDRDCMPSDIDMLKTRIRLLSRHSNYEAMKEILGDDLLDTGVPK